jgi:hypothetical protein
MEYAVHMAFWTTYIAGVAEFTVDNCELAMFKPLASIKTGLD